MYEKVNYAVFSCNYLPILQSQMERWLGNNEEMDLIIKKCTTLLFLLFFMNCVFNNEIVKKMKQNISQYMKEGGCKSVWYSTEYSQRGRPDHVLKKPNGVHISSVKSLTSEAISSATYFFMRTLKISHFPGL